MANAGLPDPNKTSPQTSAELKLSDNTPVGQKHSSLHTGGYHKAQYKKELAANEMTSRMAELDYDKFMEMLNTRTRELGQQGLRKLDEGAVAEFAGNLSSFEYKEKALKEDDFYPLLCESIQGVLDLAAQDTTHAAQRKLVIKDTADRYDILVNLGASMDPGNDTADATTYRRKVDLCIYRESDAAAGEQGSHELTVAEFKRAVGKAERKKWLGRARWSSMKVFIEVKKDSPTPFSSKGFLVDTKATKEGRGQIADYAARVRLRQHRVFLYTVSVHRNEARLLCWDQAGVLVSKTFDYKAKPYDLLNFFYQIGQMDDTQLGLDPTVTPATTEDLQLWNNLAESKNYEHLKARLDAARQEPLSRVEVNGDGLEIAVKRWEHQKLPAKSTVTLVPSSPTRRGTKGYIALDVEKQRFVYLKDYWRVEHERARPEIVTYAHLHAAGVEYIPDIVCGGDVYSKPSIVQRTRSQEHLTGYSPHLHARIIIEQIGRRLNDYKNSHELVLVMRDALRAHQQAWTKAKILHRDINDGNIIIDDTGSPWRARLIDWDQSKSIYDLNKGATNAVRSGTWAFLSGLLVYYPRKPYELSDDLESFLQILLWMATRFHQRRLSATPHNLAIIIQAKYFAIEVTSDGYWRGTESKKNEIRLGDLPIRKLKCPAFKDLLTDLMRLFKIHYDLLDDEVLDALYDYTPSDDLQMYPASDREVLLKRLEDAVKDSPLRNHDRMLAIFDEICQRNVCFPSDTQTIPFDWHLADKVEDQFKDIPEFLPNSSGASPKRTGEGSVDERESKRSKGGNLET